MEVPIDTALNLDAWLDTQAATWPVAPTQRDRRFIAIMAAEIACAHRVQAAALAGDAATFTAAHDAELRRIIDTALQSGVLHRKGFWGSCLTSPALRAELAAASRTAAYAAIRGGATRLAITVHPTVGDEREQPPPDPNPPPTRPARDPATAAATTARRSFREPPSITTDPLPPHPAPAAHTATPIRRR